MRRVIIESPYAGDVKRNMAYVIDCMLDCFRRGEAPFASHLLYTMALNDLNAGERELGIAAGFAWRGAAEATVVYTDFGISDGMRRGIEHARSIGKVVEYRKLGIDQ